MPTGADHATRVIAQQVQRLRKTREWTAQRLADEMTRAGVKWDRQVVAKLENNRRQSVSVAELYALGHVFGVPPAVLMFPVGRAETVEVLPDRPVDTWAAARWFMGDDQAEAYDPAGTLTGDPDEWKTATAPLHLSREHDRLAAEYTWTLLDLQFFSDDPKARQQKKTGADFLLRDLRSVRAEMRRHGMTPPELGNDLRYVDERRHVHVSPEQAQAYERERPGDAWKLRAAGWTVIPPEEATGNDEDRAYRETSSAAE